MKVELTKAEALFIAEALRVYAINSIETAKRDKPLLSVEVTGRALCSMLSQMAAGNPRDNLEIEEAFLKARNEFCGIGDDKDIAAMLDGTDAKRRRK